MHDAGGVHHLQRAGDLPRVVEGVALAHRILEPLAHAAAGKVFEREVQIIGRDAEIDDIGDRAMVQARENLALAGESLPILVRDARKALQILHLEGDHLSKVAIAREIHRRGGGVRDLLEQPVSRHLRIVRPRRSRANPASAHSPGQNAGSTKGLQRRGQLRDIDRVDRPVVDRPRLHGPRRETLVAMTGEHEDRHERRARVQARDGRKRIRAAVLLHELDDDQDGAVGAQLLGG